MILEKNEIKQTETHILRRKVIARTVDGGEKGKERKGKERKEVGVAMSAWFGSSSVFVLDLLLSHRFATH